MQTVQMRQRNLTQLIKVKGRISRLNKEEDREKT